MKVYVVKEWAECGCNFPGYGIVDIFLSRDEAEKKAKELYNAFVDEYIVK